MDDAKIVEPYWKRDEQVILATSKKYEAYFLSIARNILGDEEDAKECVNDALLGAWNSIPPNRPEQLSAYLGKLVRNVSFNRYKKSRTKKRGSGQIPAVLEELTEVVSGTDDVETVWSEKYLSYTLDIENTKPLTYKNLVLLLEQDGKRKTYRPFS